MLPLTLFRLSSGLFHLNITNCLCSINLIIAFGGCGYWPHWNSWISHNTLPLFCRVPLDSQFCQFLMDPEAKLRCHTWYCLEWRYEPSWYRMYWSWVSTVPDTIRPTGAPTLRPSWPHYSAHNNTSRRSAIWNQISYAHLPSLVPRRNAAGTVEEWYNLNIFRARIRGLRCFIGLAGIGGSCLLCSGSSLFTSALWRGLARLCRHTSMACHRTEESILSTSIRNYAGLCGRCCSSWSELRLQDSWRLFQVMIACRTIPWVSVSPLQHPRPPPWYSHPSSRAIPWPLKTSWRWSCQPRCQPAPKATNHPARNKTSETWPSSSPKRQPDTSTKHQIIWYDY